MQIQGIRAGGLGQGTYSFIVCRLCKFPLRVRYMPRSISVGPPTLRPQGSLQGAPARTLYPRLQWLQWCSLELSKCGVGSRWNPGWMTGFPSTSPGWDSDGRSQEMGGTRRGSREEISLLANPVREPVKGACVCKGQPLGPPPAGSQTQLFVTGLPVTMAPPVGVGTSQQITGREGRGRERRLCPPGWQGLLFLAKHHF